MARVLIERETIYSEEVDMLMDGKKYDEILKFMDEQDKKHEENPFKKFESGAEASDGDKSVDGKNGDGDGSDNGGKSIRF